MIASWYTRSGRQTALIVACCSVFVSCRSESTPQMVSQFPSPMEETIRSHERVPIADVSARAIQIEDVLPQVVEVFLPDTSPTSLPDRILIHFHGASYIPLAGLAALSDPPVLAVVNLGSGSSVYERPFLNERTFSQLISSIRDAADGELANMSLEATPQIFLSGFSAGYGAIRAILRSHVDDVEGVLLLDGLHTDYIPDRLTLNEGGQLNEEKMAGWLAIASASLAGEKSFVFTHSEIFPGTYVSTTEAASYLLEKLEITAQPVLEWGSGGMQLLSRADSSRFSILGFAGNTAPDHMDHLHNIGAFLPTLFGKED